MYQESLENVKVMDERLELAMLEYEQDKPKFWVVFAAFVFMGLILGVQLPALVNKVNNSLYSRDQLDNIMKTLLGEHRLEDVLTDEILIVAYDYNSQEPRFFSKYFSHEDPAIYDMPVGNATGASSAAPTFFDPKVQQNGYGMTELQIDGGIICNNPSLYAYEIAKDLRNHKKIRLLSIGTGEKSFSPLESAGAATKLSYIQKMGEFMMNIDTYTAHSFMANNIEDPANRYLRLQTVSNIGMDKIDKKSIDGLKADGEKLYDENKEELEKFLRQIIDERYGPKSTPPAPAA
mmetsp:Transcript_4126/g.6982  ORF Transcript_4126/g.6982 Transcript_4126/m.6982 type:complete len:291 (-) Transcript_4126:43-915(-)